MDQFVKKQQKINITINAIKITSTGATHVKSFESPSIVSVTWMALKNQQILSKFMKSKSINKTF